MRIVEYGRIRTEPSETPLCLPRFLQLLLDEWRFQRLRGVFGGDFGRVWPKCSANIHRVWIVSCLTEIPGALYS